MAKTTGGPLALRLILVLLCYCLRHLYPFQSADKGGNKTLRRRSLSTLQDDFRQRLQNYSSLERPVGSLSLEKSPLSSFLQLGAADWMSLLDDAALISEVSIPGTHNTMAYIAARLCRTQTWSLREQLESGIRYLDIRCRPQADYFQMHHGVCDLHQSWDDVLAVVQAFLQDHPTEIILMRIRNEHRPRHDALDFDVIWDLYMQSEYGPLFVTDLTAIPTLGEVRGRIVIFSNEEGPRPDYGFDFFGGAQTFVQDRFSVKSDQELEEKVQLIFETMETAPGRSNSRITFNHLSGVGLPYIGFLPVDVAEVTNQAAYDLIGTGGWKRNMGVLILDFPGEGLLARILLSNFGRAPTPALRTLGNWNVSKTTACADGGGGMLNNPGAGGTLQANAKAKDQLENNAARSVAARGPIEAGTRLLVGGREDTVGQADSTIITFVRAVPESMTVCISDLRETVAETYFVQHYQPYLEVRTNLPTRFIIETPTSEMASFATNLTRDVQWTASFCFGKSSKALQGGLILGWVRSKPVRGCQSLAQARPACLTEDRDSYWTGWLHHDHKCRPGFFVGQVKCFGVECFRIAMHCFRANTELCVLDTSGPSSVQQVSVGEEFFCPFGSVLTGIECQQTRCRSLKGFCTKLFAIESS